MGNRRVLDRLTSPLVHFMERYYPELFLFIFMITLLTFLSAYFIADFAPEAMLLSWGNSLGSILSFTMQMALIVMISHALAHTDSVQRGLHHVGSLPRSAFQAYSMVVFLAGMLCFISWPLGLIGGGIIARKVGETTKEKGIRVHYPLLVAGAFCGNVIWHMGYSASAPLFVATPGHSMIAKTGGVIPITQTVFTAWNIALAVIVLVGVSVLAANLRPRETEIIELPDNLADEDGEPPSAIVDERPVAKLENSRMFSVVIALILMLFLGVWFREHGFSLNLNVVNWSFLSLTLLLCRSPKHFLHLVEKAAPAAGPLILAYPFYAGIIGVVTDSGMAAAMSAWFASIATPETLPLWAFGCAMIVNLFIPSGGAQWIVQGPIFLDSANAMGVEPSLIVMSVAYGDQLTNLLQPLPAIPLLALAGLRLKHIMGYSFVFFIAAFVLLGTGLTLVSML